MRNFSIMMPEKAKVIAIYFQKQLYRLLPSHFYQLVSINQA